MLCAINQLQGIVAIHSSEEFEFEGQFIFNFVKTGGTNVLLAPFWIFTSQFGGNSLIHFTKNGQVAIIHIAKLIS